MSWTPIDVKIIADLKVKGYLDSKPLLAEVGSQDLARSLLDDQSMIRALCREFGADECIFSVPEITSSENMAAQELPHARQLWGWLGFSYFCLALDNDPRTISVDLNYDEAPAHLKKRASVVSNIGATSHFANQLNAFKVIHDTCSVGGIMYHHVPAEGFMTHGLIKYDPKFFWMLARSNGYKWLYWDFRGTTETTRLHDDALGELKKFHADDFQRFESYSISNGSLIVVMQKSYDLDFVAPLDTPNGLLPDPTMSDRYWTVFQPARFQALIEKIEAGKQIATQPPAI